jgi:hypothetical protein
MVLYEQAMHECNLELLAGCRIPIMPGEFKLFAQLLEANFKRYLDNPRGPKRWQNDGLKMRDNARFIGTLAEFFTNRKGNAAVGFQELLAALLIVQWGCGAGLPGGRQTFEYCKDATMGFDRQRQDVADVLKALTDMTLPDR